MSDLYKEVIEFIMEKIGVKDGEMFLCKGLIKSMYRFKNYELEYMDDNNKWFKSSLSLDYLIKQDIKIIKEPTSEDIICMRAFVIQGYRWVAKDKSGATTLFSGKPHKQYSCSEWESETIQGAIRKGFDFISWEDKEPFDMVEYLKGIG